MKLKKKHFEIICVGLSRDKQMRVRGEHTIIQARRIDEFHWNTILRQDS